MEQQNGPILPDFEPLKKIQIAKFSYDKFPVG